MKTQRLFTLLLLAGLAIGAVSGTKKGQTAPLTLNESLFRIGANVATNPVARFDWYYEGQQKGDELGYAVSTAGDVNGDGYDDVIVGAPKATKDASRDGVAYVFHGSSTGLSDTPDWSVSGGQKGADFGAAVSTAGDVNGDGYDDVIVGAPSYGQPETGRAYVYLGSEAGLDATAQWWFEIGQTDARVGVAVSTAGDVNGDGYDDVIIGAQGYSNGEAQEGAALLFYGSPAGVITSSYWITESNQASALFGAAVGAAGDVNGDGYDDVIVGAPQYDKGQIDEGGAFIFFGSDAGLNLSHDWMADSDQAESEFGAAVGSAGNTNGDLYSDVIIGAPHYADGQAGEGAVFVFHGSVTGPGATFARMADGDQEGASFGRSVGCVPDMDGDGYDDVIVGAPNWENDQADEGAAFVFYGSATGIKWIPRWMTEGDKAETRFGYAVSGAGDVNGDDYGDLIVGAPQYRVMTEIRGRAFVYHGSKDGGAAALVFLPLVLHTYP